MTSTRRRFLPGTGACILPLPLDRLGWAVQEPAAAGVQPHAADSTDVLREEPQTYAE